MKLPWIIHIFALLHAVTAVSCRLAGVDDELLLTILTIALVLLICYKKKLSMEFTAAIVIIGNIIGYLMGNLGAKMLELLISSPIIVHGLSTTVTTEVLGWSTVAISNIFKRNSSADSNKPMPSTYIRWVLLAAGGIFFIRLAIAFIFERNSLSTSDTLASIGMVFSNSVGIIILTCLNIIYIRYIGKLQLKAGKALGIAIFIGFTILASLIEDFILGFKIPFIVAALTQVTIYCIVFIVNYTISSRNEMNRQREKAHLAQYRYLKLKRQVNPHFLFNSLNILDCLVCDEKTEQASTYIHKLAGIYRYMIKSEDEELVLLRDELVFVNLYVDLLKVRFPAGFDVKIDTPEESLSRHVLPCSLQLLIENAIKHNTVTEANPLIINIVSDNINVQVSNNIIPKVTVAQSTGLGQKYIRNQYQDISGKEIDILKTDDRYCVTLPLL